MNELRSLSLKRIPTNSIASVSRVNSKFSPAQGEASAEPGPTAELKLAEARREPRPPLFKYALRLWLTFAAVIHVPDHLRWRAPSHCNFKENSHRVHTILATILDFEQRNRHLILFAATNESFAMLIPAIGHLIPDREWYRPNKQAADSQ
ncbi:MAG: hypothetical protein JWM11_7132 [Planctomycetaceae bacterium]|nr:hypothetical protein [Planctomycetaceae bacterium]